ncbi:MAG: N-acetylornithine carbamoyltransferase [Acidobacteria bacterium]|nr:N-acetylornithine carbamoyltransferase [Acidobacteriota bacterium]MYH20728.1 N-acetylornithine carbamoyltransferase [Acidobacteriota bacterium]MYK79857.1 N-acetylornithine carbamoyltransferase [Acidobacteriota bacterium]
MREVHRLEDLGAARIRELVSLAGRLRERPEPRALEGKVLALLFLNPSLRTQASFQAAMSRLGGGSFVIAPDRFIHKLEFDPDAVMDGETAENIAEAVPVLASYGDALGVRMFAAQRDLAEDLADARFERIRGLCGKPFLNMESAARHPCQSLADWRTLDDLGIPASGGRLVLSWTQHPHPLPLAVASDTLRMAAMRGMEVTVARPDGYELPESLMAQAGQLASASGGSVRESDDPAEAMEGAHAVYAKSWASTRHYGDPEADLALRAGLSGWTVDGGWFAAAREDCRFLHCLPVRRGVVVAGAVLDGPRSAVVHQAENRMWTQMAALHRMLS